MDVSSAHKFSTGNHTLIMTLSYTYVDILNIAIPIIA